MFTLPRKPYEDHRQSAFTDRCPTAPRTKPASLLKPAPLCKQESKETERVSSPADAFHGFMRNARMKIKQADAELAQQMVMPLDSLLIPTSPTSSSLTSLSSLSSTSGAATSSAFPSGDLFFDDYYRSALNVLVQQLMEAVLVVDAMGTIQMMSNKAAELLSGGLEIKSKEIIGQPWQAYLTEPQKIRYQNMLDEQLYQQRQLEHDPIEATLALPQGDSLDVEFSISYLALSEPVFAIVIRDLTKHKSEYKQLYHWASTDCLTKLANRRVFDASLRTQWQACTEVNKPISVVIIDVDYFKLFNDKHGHVQGDHCLQKIANVIAHSLPCDECVAARYGGEEFGLILPGFDAKQAEAMAEYIQLEINNLKYTDVGLDDSVSVSVSQGIAAEVDGQFRTGTALLCAADTALYRAKADGRNRINLSC